MIKPVRTSSHYHIPISMEQMEIVIDYDDEKDYEFMESFTAIDGVEEVDYNGHFGAAIFLHITTVNDTPETWEKINTIIEGIK